LTRSDAFEIDGQGIGDVITFWVTPSQAGTVQSSISFVDSTCNTEYVQSPQVMAGASNLSEYGQNPFKQMREQFDQIRVVPDSTTRQKIAWTPTLRTHASLDDRATATMILSLVRKVHRRYA
jgi:hypothetical protein